jgi:hypothetical protein
MWAQGAERGQMMCKKTLTSLCCSITACGFVSIEMAKIVVGSSSLTQPLLLYPGLGPAMLEQHRRSY